MARNETGAALARWTEAGFRKVLLPTGSWARVRLVGIDRLFRRGVFPHELEGMVIRFVTGAVKVAELAPDELRDFLGMKDQLIVETVTHVLAEGDPDAEPGADGQAVWEELDLRPYLLDLEQVVASEDLDKLGLIAVRYVTPEAVTADSKMRLGIMSRIEAMRISEEEVGKTAAGFRVPSNEPVGADPGADGADVQLPAERSARARGSGRRSSGGSGSLPATGER